MSLSKALVPGVFGGLMGVGFIIGSWKLYENHYANQMAKPVKIISIRDISGKVKSYSEDGREVPSYESFPSRGNGTHITYFYDGSVETTEYKNMRREGQEKRFPGGLTYPTGKYLFAKHHKEEKVYWKDVISFGRSVGKLRVDDKGESLPAPGFFVEGWPVDKPSHVTDYSNDRPHGRSIEYDKNGNMISDAQYITGQLVNVAKYKPGEVEPYVKQSVLDPYTRFLPRD
jgi:antitoxin component YwqK of YwqJK toxin-antitoxin module